MILNEAQKARISLLKQKNFFEFDKLDNCFCCGKNTFKTILDKDRYGFALNYVKCINCSYIFANPYYSVECLNKFYSEHYAVIYGRSDNTLSLFKDEYINAIESIFPLVKKFKKKPGFALDYGCAHGGSLMAFPKSWKRIGYDYDPTQMEYGKRFGLDLRDMQTFPECSEKCDVVMLNQVLEHVSNPVTMLKTIENLLNDDGILYVEVPSMDAIYKSNVPILAFKNAHRHFFCIDSLKKIASHAGLMMIYGEENSSRTNGKRGALRAIFCKNAATVMHDIRPIKNIIPANIWADRIVNVLEKPDAHNVTRVFLAAVNLPVKVIRWCRRKILCSKMLKKLKNP